MARGLIIAAPASGAGKTTLTLGLIAALTRAGQRVRPFKVGPDYIDPTYLSAAAGGVPCANLDPWAMRPATLAVQIADLGGDEVAVVEGVMGLYDGPGSTAALARQTGWPILLVIDAGKSAQTAAAVAQGLVLRDPDLTFAGFVFNRVGSARHAAMVRDGLGHEDANQKPHWFLPPRQDLHMPSRHLGLFQAEEREDLELFLSAAARWAAPMAKDALTLMGESMGSATAQAIDKHAQKNAAINHQIRGLSRFGLTFAYNHHPYPLPENGIFLPGGYPELYLEAITADPNFLPNLRQAAAAGISIYGECGGFMVLGQAIIDGEGARHEMAGLLPLITTFAARKRHLGYREIRTLRDFGLSKAGDFWRGHEFHYTQIAWSGQADPLFHAHDAYGSDLGPQGMQVGSVAGSYLHLIDKAA